MNSSGSFFQMSSGLTEHIEFKNELRTKLNIKLETIVIIHDIPGKNLNMICKDLVSECQENKSLTKETRLCKNYCFLLKYS